MHLKKDEKDPKKTVTRAVASPFPPIGLPFFHKPRPLLLPVTLGTALSLSVLISKPSEGVLVVGHTQVCHQCGVSYRQRGYTPAHSALGRQGEAALDGVHCPLLPYPVLGAP